MRPSAVVVAVMALVGSFLGLIWLGQSVSGVSVDPSKPVKIEDQPDFPKPSETGPHPKVEFAETEFDFGTKRRFSSGSHKFEIRNTGEATLKLKAGETTCQCTVGELGATEVAPGESTTVELKWTIKQPGPGFQHSAKIHTNDPGTPEKTLVIKGFIGVDLTTYPEQRWSLGSLNADGTTEFDGFVFSHISENFEVSNIALESPGLSAEAFPMSEDELKALSQQMTQNEPDPDGSKAADPAPDIKCGYRIHVTANDKIAVGQFSEAMTIHTTVEEVPELAVAVSGVRPGPFQFFPLPGTLYRHGGMLIDAGKVPASGGHSAGLLVVCRGFDGELKFDEVTASPSWLTVSLKPDPGDGSVRRYRMTLEFPDELPPMVRSINNPATLQIRTNHPHAEVLNLKAAFVVQE